MAFIFYPKMIMPNITLHIKTARGLTQDDKGASHCDGKRPRGGGDKRLPLALAGASWAVGFHLGRSEVY